MMPAERFPYLKKKINFHQVFCCCCIFVSIIFLECYPCFLWILWWRMCSFLQQRGWMRNGGYWRILHSQPQFSKQGGRRYYSYWPWTSSVWDVASGGCQMKGSWPLAGLVNVLWATREYKRVQVTSKKYKFGTREYQAAWASSRLKILLSSSDQGATVKSEPGSGSSWHWM